MRDDVTRAIIQALKFVKVATKRGFLTDVSVAMILVEMERRLIGLTDGIGYPGVTKGKENVGLQGENEQKLV